MKFPSNGLVDVPETRTGFSITQLYFSTRDGHVPGPIVKRHYLNINCEHKPIVFSLDVLKCSLFDMDAKYFSVFIKFIPIPDGSLPKSII